MATKKSAVKDLTNGSPVKLILGFALPLLLGMLFQQFYSMVDTIIVGKFLGAKALAAVGSTGSINFMIVGFCMGVCNGFAIPVAQMFGAGDRKALCRYVGNGAVLAGILSVVMTVLVCIWCRRHSDSDENPVRYSGRCIRLHLCYFPRNSAYGAL